MSARGFFEWIAESSRTAQPWLILGKGPSFEKRSQYDLTAFASIGLNHVCREQRVTLAHIIDLDVVDACGEALLTNTEAVVMPWYPHVRNHPTLPLMKDHVSSKTLDELATSHPILARLASEGRLLTYHLSSGRGRRDDSPVITARFFSVEAALNLLATAGVRVVRSLGIDGGTTYSATFHDLSGKTLLANQRSSFDKQFEEMAKTILTTGVDYAPLDVESPVRIFVAAEPAQMLAVDVLAFSIRKHASITTHVEAIHQAGIEIPQPRDARNAPRTPFSFQRFLVPQLAGYRGRAIYLDSDMQVFKDIRGLWTIPFEGSTVLAADEPRGTGRRPQFSVMMLDCDALRWDIRDIVAQLDRGELTYEALMQDLAIEKQVRAGISHVWNSLERFDAGETALVHYTDMHTQPWISTANKLEYLWTRDLLEAIELGAITVDRIRDETSRGYLRPSLLWQVENGVDDSLRLPRAVRALDRTFIAPYKLLPRHGATSWLNPLPRAAAIARHYYRATGLEAIARRVRDQIFK